MGAPGKTVTYTYDWQDRRIARAADADSDAVWDDYRYQVYQGSDPYMEVTDDFNGLSDGITSATTVSNYYLYGPADDQVLAVTTAGVVQWGLADHQGSVRDVLNNSGSVVEHRKYDSFGTVSLFDSTGQPITDGGTLNGTFTESYTGKSFDLVAGLFYYDHRWYDSATGRFTSEDPSGLASGMNLFAYCGNSPIDRNDPTGMFGKLVNAIGGSISSTLGSALGGVRSVFAQPTVNALDWGLGAASNISSMFSPSPQSSLSYAPAFKSNVVTFANGNTVNLPAGPTRGRFDAAGNLVIQAQDGSWRMAVGGGIQEAPSAAQRPAPPVASSWIGGGVQGLAQGGANIAYGTQRTAYGFADAMANGFSQGDTHLLNGQDSFSVGTPIDWARNQFSYESDSTHYWSTTIGGNTTFAVALGMGLGAATNLAERASLATVNRGLTNLGAVSRSADYTRSAQVLSEALDVAQSPTFVARAQQIGFNDAQIAAIPERLAGYGSNVGEIATGGFVNNDVLLVGRNGLFTTRWQRMAHEIGHVLDDVANPGLFEQAAQPTFGFRGYYQAESVAYRIQYGFNPVPVTALNAGFQSHPIVTTAIIGGTTYGLYEGSSYLFGQ